MDKPFRSIEQQVAKLNQRGVATNEDTPLILLHEGYYSVVNGYGKAFLDREATKRARDDRYVAGTTFDQIYQLYLFDRDLRALTFKALMCVECTLRSIISYTFCEQHRKLASYLNPGCYAQRSEYLGGPENYESDLDWLLDKLERCARGVKADSHEEDSDEGARINWYRTHYDTVPLWVLFSELSFGNLRYFFALMKRSEQRAVCNRLRETCGTTHKGQTLAPQGMLDDLEALGELRNRCAHEERVYDFTFGSRQTYPQISQTLAAYLADRDERRYYAELSELLDDTRATSKAVDSVISRVWDKG